MEELLFPILVALTVAAFGWWLTQFATDVLRGERKKIAQRLTSEYGDVYAAQRRSILLQLEASGFSGSLARMAFFQKLYRNLIQAFPNVSLTQFLATASVLAVVSFLLGTVVFDSVLIGLASGAGAGYLPFMVLAGKRARRQRAI